MCLMCVSERVGRGGPFCRGGRAGKGRRDKIMKKSERSDPAVMYTIHYSMATCACLLFSTH